MPEHHVRAALDGTTGEEIDWSPEQPGRLLLNQRVFDQSPVRARLECDEDVDITVGPEVSPYHRPEQRQIIHRPARAAGEQLRLAHPIRTEPRHHVRPPAAPADDRSMCRQSHVLAYYGPFPRARPGSGNRVAGAGGGAFRRSPTPSKPG